jgi:hypothetical protein
VRALAPLRSHAASPAWALFRACTLNSATVLGCSGIPREAVLMPVVSGATVATTAPLIVTT